MNRNWQKNVGPVVASLLVFVLLSMPVRIVRGQHEGNEEAPKRSVLQNDNASAPDENSFRTDNDEPCDHSQGHGVGLLRKCAGSSSSGVSKGDFNGDGFADLAVGVPGEDIETVANAEDAGAVNVIYGSQTGLDADGAPGVPTAQFWSLSSSGIPGVPANSDYFGQAIASGDFNGDGYSDIAIGSRDHDAGLSGAVNVIYGSPFGLATSVPNFPAPQRWTQGSEGILGGPEDGDKFGFSLSWGDFNNDGYGDLVIGVPFEDVGSIQSAGAINILYGSQVGLSALNNQLWTQDTLGVPGASGKTNSFGMILSAGDYNNDGNDDLAVGIPSYAVGGVVIVLYGSSTFGLTTDTSGIPAAQLWSQNSSFIADSAEPYDHFGAGLASGDFNGDSFADLAIGVPNETLLNQASDEIVEAGAVNVIYGRSGGLSATASPVPGTTVVTTQFWTQDSQFVPDSMEFSDHFGSVLTAGDVNGDGKKDLIVGTPDEDLEEFSADNAGAVFVIYGSQFRLSTTIFTPVMLNASATPLLSSIETDDQFGASLSSWNFGNGPPADIAIGAPGKSLGAFSDLGTVSVVYGSSGPFFGGQLLSQNTSGVPDNVEEFDGFGGSLY